MFQHRRRWAYPLSKLSLMELLQTGHQTTGLPTKNWPINRFPPVFMRGFSHSYRVHRKQGEVFALTPIRGLTPAWAGLLPAQSLIAKLYRQSIRFCLAYGIPFPLETQQIALDSSLGTLAGKCVPPLILPGNPKGPAPRTVSIYPGADGRTPGVVVKSGVTPEARALIRKEAALMRQAHLTGMVPQVYKELETEGLSAFAMEFIPGASPAWPASTAQLSHFLSQMISGEPALRIEDTEAWKALTPHLDAKALACFKEFSQRLIPRCLFHGDFAPWNVRMRPDGQWVALDWERGDPTGIPGWDWLHFVIQPAVLVKRWSLERVLDYARTTLRCEDFCNYFACVASKEELHEIAEPLLRSYLLYNWYVLQPAGRARAHQALAEWY